MSSFHVPLSMLSKTNDHDFEKSLYIRTKNVARSVEGWGTVCGIAIVFRQSILSSLFMGVTELSESSIVAAVKPVGSIKP